MTHVLILGGTGEARALALALHPGTRVTSSLAGRVKDPALPVGEVRVGGFGGVDGLTKWLQDNDISAIVDATHPFAEGITANAVAACAATGIRLLRLQRPGWDLPGAHVVGSLDEAVAVAGRLGSRIFVTTGRQGLAAFADVPGTWLLVRCVDPPEVELRTPHELLLSRGPYTLSGELDLMRGHRVDVLVTKDSGGALTSAKLSAAEELGIPVVVVRRPAVPDVPVVASVDEALAWLGGP